MIEKQKAPAFQMYAKDFLTGTIEMSNAEVGSYIRLLCNQWINGPLKDDMKILAKYCYGEVEGIDAAVKKFDKNKDGNLLNKKLEKVRESQKKFNQSQSEKGKKSAEKRWGGGLSKDNPGYFPVTIGLQPESNPASATASASTTAYIASKQAEVFEYLRFATQKCITDVQLQFEARELLKIYGGQEIKNLRSLCNSWANNIRPVNDGTKKLVL